jgi:hypothetical protein
MSYLKYVHFNLSFAFNFNLRRYIEGSLKHLDSGVESEAHDILKKYTAGEWAPGTWTESPFQALSPAHPLRARHKEPPAPRRSPSPSPSPSRGTWTTSPFQALFPVQPHKPRGYPPSPRPSPPPSPSRSGASPFQALSPAHPRRARPDAAPLRHSPSPERGGGTTPSQSTNHELRVWAL